MPPLKKSIRASREQRGSEAATTHSGFLSCSGEAVLIVDLPIRNIHPDCLADDIADVLDRPAEWSAWSRQSRLFVEKWHNPRLIAAAMIDVYRDPKGAPSPLDRLRAGNNPV